MWNRLELFLPSENNFFDDLNKYKLFIKSNLNNLLKKVLPDSTKTLLKPNFFIVYRIFFKSIFLLESSINFITLIRFFF